MATFMLLFIRCVLFSGGVRGTGMFFFFLLVMFFVHRHSTCFMLAHTHIHTRRGRKRDGLGKLKAAIDAQGPGE